jgi:hypothetical protein
MKTMTCKQRGGPCDQQHQGQTADEVIKAQGRHLRQMVADGDNAHAPALNEMKGRWTHPVSGMGWYRATKRDLRLTSRGLTALPGAARRCSDLYTAKPRRRERPRAARFA